MSELQEKPEADREAAVQEWEKQAHSSLVADKRKKKASGLFIAMLAGLGLGAAWMFKGYGASANPAVAANLTVADRKPVPKLKNQSASADSSARVSNATAQASSPTPATVVQQESGQPSQGQQLEMQRQEEARRMLAARMKSAIMPPTGTGQLPTELTEKSGEGAESAATASDVTAVRGAQDVNSRFARTAAGGGVPVSMARQLDNLEYKVLQGKMIEAVVEPRIKSDLPNLICATVQRDVYGAQGRLILIPWGSRVCGLYNAELRKGQDRIFTIWSVLRRPDGVEIQIDSYGADQLGTAGMAGVVDTHFAQIFASSAMISIIGAGAANSGVSANDQFNSGAYYRQEVQHAAARTSEQVLQAYVNIPPTVTSAAGARIRIYMNRDLDFSTVYQNEIQAEKQDGITIIQ